jgi:hypothetical protein
LVTEDTKICFLLDLFDAEYNKAYVSVVDFVSVRDIYYHRIEMILPNVGRLCLYQKFVDFLDEQIPYIDVFYSIANTPNLNKKIKNTDLLKRATQIIFKANKFFENHPEYLVNNDSLIKRIRNNQKMLQKHYKQNLRIKNSFLLFSR